MSSLLKKPSMLLLNSDEKVSGAHKIQPAPMQQEVDPLDPDVSMQQGMPVGEPHGELQPAPQAPPVPPAAGVLPFPAGLQGVEGGVATQGVDPNQGAQITIKYADGREEIIHILNPDNI